MIAIVKIVTVDGEADAGAAGGEVSGSMIGHHSICRVAFAPIAGHTGRLLDAHTRRARRVLSLRHCGHVWTHDKNDPEAPPKTSQAERKVRNALRTYRSHGTVKSARVPTLDFGRSIPSSCSHSPQ